jgi:hypothetical protein
MVLFIQVLAVLTLDPGLLKHMASFKKLDTIILRPRVVGLRSPEATIKKCAAALKGLQPTTDKRQMFISYEYFLKRAYQGDGRQLTGDLTEVGLS